MNRLVGSADDPDARICVNKPLVVSSMVPMLVCSQDSLRCTGDLILRTGLLDRLMISRIDQDIAASRGILNDISKVVFKEGHRNHPYVPIDEFLSALGLRILAMRVDTGFTTLSELIVMSSPAVIS